MLGAIVFWLALSFWILPWLFGAIGHLGDGWAALFILIFWVGTVAFLPFMMAHGGLKSILRDILK